MIQMENTISEQIEKLLNINQRWLTMAEACQYAKISKNTLMKCIHSGDVRASKRHGKWIVDRLSIDRYYESDTEELLYRDIACRVSL